MIDVQPPQVGGGGAPGWLPWVGSLVVAIGAALWTALSGKDAKLIGALEAQIAEQNKQLSAQKASSDATITKLGEKLDKQREDAWLELEEERRERLEDQRRTTKLLIRMQAARSEPNEWQEAWEEAPTGVRDFLELAVPGRKPDPRRELDSSLPPPRRRRP